MTYLTGVQTGNACGRGWANVGYHRKNYSSFSHSGVDDVSTPNFDALVSQGLELDRNYVHKFCSPTRSSIQSGRLPVHVNLVNGDVTSSNPDDDVSGWAGIPRNMTGLAQVLKNAKYRTHMIGKIDHSPY
jgi:arylsulfatase B